MSRIVPEHFNPRGLPKRRFDTIEEAAAFRARTPGVKSKKIYECQTCGGYHLGRRKRVAA